MLDPYVGMLDEHRRALELIGREVGEKVPFIMTIFNPLAQAKNLVGHGLLPHLRAQPATLKAGLETITASTVRFIDAARKTGIAGIFLALQHATYDLLSEAEYCEFGRPYDLRVLEATEGLWFNALHVHGENVMFDLVADYANHAPAHAVNWHDRETWPSLREALPRFPGALIGGLHRVDDMLRGDPDTVRGHVRVALDETGGRRLVLGTGCVMFVNTPVGNIRAAREAVEP